jgi:hypothetical protein
MAKTNIFKYCKFKLPLDIAEDVLMRGGDELATAIAKLDADGWNKYGVVHTITTTRAYAIQSIVLNEILEVSLAEFDSSTNNKLM